MDNNPRKALTETILVLRRQKNKRGRPTTYDAIAHKFGPKITRIIIWRLINEPDYEPHDTNIRLALGLPALAPAPVCPVHGVVHPGRCPKPHTPHQAWLSEEEVNQRLEFIRRNYEQN